MKFDEVYGYAVIPMGLDRQPSGVVLWCATFEEAEVAYSQELHRTGAYQPVLVYRSSETAQPAR